MDYKNTLNITLSDKDPGAMPQRGGLPAREPEIQKRWDEMDLYRLSVEKDAPLGTFVLHDGPPYSNGDIHLGHALNKIAKDIIVKYKTMKGFRSPYVPGWDNHGMPIENEVSKEFRKKGEKPDKVTMRKRCREYASGFVEKQKTQFKRLGIRGDWDNPYLTMSTDFEAKIVEVFGELAQKGYIYRGLKPVLWCAFCETALADAEVEYEEHTSNSIFVRFPVHKDPRGVFGRGNENPKDCYTVIWTTTPWTIPANLALAVHPEAEYLVIEVNDEAHTRYLLAEPLAECVLAALGLPGTREHARAGATQEAPSAVVGRAKGIELQGLLAKHPIFDRPSPVVFADYVTMEDGTGVVHTAPGHGKEDFETGVKYGLEILCPVDSSGTFTAQAGEQFAGARILGGQADRMVIEALKESGNLLAAAEFKHSYPHCWRCHNPLLFRATVQWFMNIDHELNREGEGERGRGADNGRPTVDDDGVKIQNTKSKIQNPLTHRELSLEAIRNITWFPAVSINRISSMVANRPDWCLSRQRAWGVGIPAFYCRSCRHEILSKEAIDSVVALVAREGSDAWYARPAEEILPPGFTCPKCGEKQFEKETDILDVWFDSGSSSFAVLENQVRWPLLKWPADIYLEGSDQHRGWFNSSLMVANALRGRAPYDAVITNGFTVDENGRKMSKHLGNVIDPLKVIDMYGADILRLWVSSVNYFEDMNCSETVIKQVAESYRRIRNTFRFLVNNLYDVKREGDTVRIEHQFDPETDAVPEAEMLELDRWAMAQLDRVVEACAKGYEAYEFHRVYHAVHNFCAVELSAFYLDVIKDRLYCEKADSRERRSAQTALHTLAQTLARILAPILSHTADEVWEHLKMPAKPASAQLAEFPEISSDDQFSDYHANWQSLSHIRDYVNQGIEELRHKGLVKNQLESRIRLTLTAVQWESLKPLVSDLSVVFKVSQVECTYDASDVDITRLLPRSLEVGPAEGLKCARCWLVKTDVGVDAAYPDVCGRCASVVASVK